VSDFGDGSSVFNGSVMLI